MVLAAVLIVVVLGFAALAIDTGYIVSVKGQLQNAADAAAFASVRTLVNNLGADPELTPGEVDPIARAAAVELAAANQTHDIAHCYADGGRDVRLGQVRWDVVQQKYVQNWSASPYNAVEVTLRRQSGGGEDRPIRLFFAPIIGHSEAMLNVKAMAALLPASGFDPGPDWNAPVLPLTYDEEQWNDFASIKLVGTQVQPTMRLASASGPFTFRHASSRTSDAAFTLVKGGGGGGSGSHGFGVDNWTYDPKTGAVTPGADGILEFDVYPLGGVELPSGNNGLLKFGPSGAAALGRQIRKGVTEDDVATWGGRLSLADGPITVNAHPGYLGGIKDDLAAIKGVPRALPIFRVVSGKGGQAEYQIVKFVAVRIMKVQMTGNDKHVVVQPAALVDRSAIPADIPVEQADIFTTPRLLQ